MSPLRLVAVLLSATVMFFGSGLQAQAQDYSKLPEMTLKLGHMSPGTETNPYHLLALYLEKHLPEKTGGKLKLQIFHSGQLGRDRELMEAVQFGTLDLAVITTSPMTNFVPAYTILDYPFIFRDWDHVEKMIASPWMEEFKGESEKAKFHTLAFVPRGFRSVTNSKVKIHKPEDMANLKLRVIESPIFVDTFNALGASAQAMSWGEVFTALQQGTIDGHENALNTIYDERVYEVQKYVSLTQHIFAFAAFVASPPLFDKLPVEYQEVIKQTAAEGLAEITKVQRADEMSYATKLEEKGMEINPVDDVKLFQAKMGPVYDKYNKNEAIKKYFDLISAIK